MDNKTNTKQYDVDITREEAQKQLLDQLAFQVATEGKSWDDVCVISPRKGKSSWTYREWYDAVKEDRNPVGFDEDEDQNPIDSYLRYLEYKKHRELDELRKRINKW